MNKSTPSTGTAVRCEPFSLEAALYGDAIRAELASLPPLPHERERVPLFIGYLREREKDEIAAYQTSFVPYAASLRETVLPAPSRLMQCASFLLSAVYMPLLRGGLAAYARQNAYEFLVFYDYASGIAEIAGELSTAEAEVAGNGNQYTHQAIAMVLERCSQPVPPTFSETAYPLNREKDRQGGQLLQHDPTGHTLLAAVVAEIRAEADHPAPSNGIKRIPAYQQPQLFLAGATYAQRVYTVLYPLSQ
jgi:hypothetical protein